MKKLTQLLCALALLMSLAHQASAHPLPCGPYFGVDAGISHFTSDNRDARTRDISQELDITATGFVGDILLGWAFLYYNCYWAFEFFGGINAANDDRQTIFASGANIDRVEHDITQKYQYGIATTLGYWFYQTLLFARFALLWSYFELETETFRNDASQNDRISRSRNFIGFMPGIGMAMMLTDCLMFSGMASYAFYESRTFDRLSLNPGTDEFPQVRMHPHGASVVLALTWFFGPHWGRGIRVNARDDLAE